MNAAWVVKLNLENLTIPDLSTELELSIRTAHNNIHDEMGCKSLNSYHDGFLTCVPQWVKCSNVIGQYTDI